MSGAEQSSSKRWEEDCRAICVALGISVDADNADNVADIALRRIAALKHLAVENAAYGDCVCDNPKVSGSCVYCIACALVNDLGPWRVTDAGYLKDFLEGE